MSKVHFALVGGQTMPVYLGIKYTEPEKVVFVCSKESCGKIEPIKAMLPNVETSVALFAPSDFAKIEDATKRCAEQYAGDEVTINISSGTKPWTYYFTHIFSSHANAKVFYIDQNSMVHDFDTKGVRQLGISISEQLMLSESCLFSHRSLKEYGDEDFSVIEQIKSIRSNEKQLRTFNKLTEEMSKHSNLTEVNNSDGSLIWNRKERQFIMEVNGFKPLVFTSPNVRLLVLNAGWFEVMVAQALSSWERCKDLWMNCIFKAEKNEQTTNEIDLIADIGNKLLFVECKTQIYAPTDIDKFNSVVKKCGGNGSKALFVTYESMSETNRNTCEKYGIIPFSFKSKNSNSIKQASSLQRVLECTIDKNNL